MDPPLCGSTAMSHNEWGCPPLAERCGRLTVARAQAIAKVRLSAQRSADRSVQPRSKGRCAAGLPPPCAGLPGTAWTWGEPPHTPLKSLRSVVGRAVFYCGLCAAGTRWRAARPPSETPGFLLHAWRDVVLSPTPPGSRSGCRLLRRFSSSFKGSAR